MILIERNVKLIDPFLSKILLKIYTLFDNQNFSLIIVVDNGETGPAKEQKIE